MLSIIVNLLLSTSAIISIIFLAFCLLLHFGSHFTFRQCLKTRKSTYSRRSVAILSNKSSKKNHNNSKNNNSNEMILEQMYNSRCVYQNCQNCIIPVDEENFDFFPVSFVSYVLFIIIITSLIVYKLHTISNDSQQFINNIHKYDPLYISLITNNKYDIIDWILTYSMIVLSIWDSLFSFYRYYTTMYCTLNFSLLSIKTTLKYFSFYGIPFFIVYLLQIHIYYYLYPLLILSHGIINFWCTWMFGKILIDSTMQYYNTEKMIENIHDDMLKSVYFMRNTSMISCFISFICQSGFVITSNTQILYFYPIFWCIGCIIFSLNFVRNRSKIHETSFKVYQIFKHCTFQRLCIQNRDVIISKPPINQPKTLGTSVANTNINIQTNEHSIENNESTAKSTDITLTKSSNTTNNKLSHTHNMMDSIDENDQIGEIDVFEDEDEIIYSMYDDPISIMALNRNNSNKSMNKNNISRVTNSNIKRESMMKIINKDNKEKHKLNPTLNLSTLSEFNNMSIETDIDENALYDEEEYEYESEDEEISPKKTNKALELLGLTATNPKRVTLVKNELDPKKSSRSKIRKEKLMEDIKNGKQLKHNNHLNVSQIPNLKMRQRVRSLSTEDLPDHLPHKLNINKLKINKYSQSAMETPSTETNKIKLNLKPSHSDNYTPHSHTSHSNDKSFEIKIDKIYNKKEIIINKEHKVEMEKFTNEITNKLRMIQRKSEFGGRNIDAIRRLEYQNQHRLTQPTLDLHRSVSEPNSPRRLQNFFGSVKHVSPTSRSPDSDYMKMNEKEHEIKIVIGDNNEQKINRNMQRLPLENALSAPMLTPSIGDEFTPKHTPSGHRKTPSQGNTPIGNLCSIVELIDKEANVKKDKLGATLNVLVLQGFYSRKSLNSVKQLNKYNNNNTKNAMLKTINE